MKPNHSLNLQFSEKRIDQLTENRTAYTLRNAELNIYETYETAQDVRLKFPEPVLVSMLSGKKVMHLSHNHDFEFFPNESIIMPADELMRIDFPEAGIDKPTHCLALRISQEKVNSVLELVNETTTTRADDEEWKFNDHNFHFMNDVAMNQIISRLIFLFTENHPSKELFADFMLKELIIRLMQTEARHLLLEGTEPNCHQTRLAQVIKYIQEHLHEQLTIGQLSKKAYMSESHFYRCFKQTYDLTPIEFVNTERIKKSKDLLKEAENSVQTVGMQCGFNSMSYFIKLFKRYYNMTPLEYQQQYLAKQRMH